MVAICTTSFNILKMMDVITAQNSTFCPHVVFMCFVWISEQTAIISLYSINWLVLVTETECVYCAVRTGFNNLIFSWQCHGSGDQSPASHHEGQVSIPGQPGGTLAGKVALKSFFCLFVWQSKRPDRLWDPPSLLFDQQRRFFPLG